MGTIYWLLIFMFLMMVWNLFWTWFLIKHFVNQIKEEQEDLNGEEEFV